MQKKSGALLTCVCLTAHADVSVTCHLGGLVVRSLILLGNLRILLSQKGHSLGHVPIAHLQQQCSVVLIFTQVRFKKRIINSFQFGHGKTNNRHVHAKRHW